MALVKHNNNSISAVTSMASLTTGSMTLIKEQTASSSASISFVDGSSDVVLDSTYPIYKFEFINIHPSYWIMLVLLLTEAQIVEAIIMLQKQQLFLIQDIMKVILILVLQYNTRRRYCTGYRLSRFVFFRNRLR